jgi:UDP-3-O-[3-hydroxymyristoyl] N-acetylglucosamine deacetylase
MTYRRTLRRAVGCTGIGLHSGKPVQLLLEPAAAESGIVFYRSDVDVEIPARIDFLARLDHATTLSRDGVSIGTVEHVMAALAGTGVTHVEIEIDGPEVPIMDGSALRFVQAILRAGLAPVDGPLRAIRILKPVRDVQGDVVAELAPAETLSIDFEIDFSAAAIGRQVRQLGMVNGAFVHELADCRTFCLRSEVETMQAHGLALGGSLDNAVVVDGDTVLNPGGFRRADECVRHKMLDALGDLALAGAPILGAYRGVRAGHGATNRLLRLLFATPGAFEYVTLDAEAAAMQPGAGVGAADLRRAG